MKTIERKQGLESLMHRAALPPGDAINVYIAQISQPGDLSALLKEASAAIAGVRTIVVDAQTLSLSEGDAAALVRLASPALRVVLAGEGFAFPSSRVLQETSFVRAGIASIYTLEPAESIVLVTKDEPDCPRLRGLVNRAMRWRSSWQEPQEGYFDECPQA